MRGGLQIGLQSPVLLANPPQKGPIWTLSLSDMPCFSGTVLLDRHNVFTSCGMNGDDGEDCHDYNLMSLDSSSWLTTIKYNERDRKAISQRNSPKVYLYVPIICTRWSHFSFNTARMTEEL